MQKIYPKCKFTLNVKYFYIKVLLQLIQFWYDIVTLVVQNNIQKNPNAKYAVKAEISMKMISFSESAKPSAFSAG